MPEPAPLRLYKDILDPDALVWNIAYGLSQPLFEGGRLQGDIELSAAQRDELAADYADTALTAFREVETALAAEAFFKQQEIQLEKASRGSSAGRGIVSGSIRTGPGGHHHRIGIPTACV